MCQHVSYSPQAAGGSAALAMVGWRRKGAKFFLSSQIFLGWGARAQPFVLKAEYMALVREEWVPGAGKECSGGMQTKIKFDLVFVISTFN